MYDLNRTSKRIEIAGELRAVIADPDDDKFVECAVVGEASVIVSDDHHLLDLGAYRGIRIVSSAQFLSEVAQTK